MRFRCFLSKFTKKFSTQNQEKTKGRNYHFWTKMPMCNCTWASSTLLFFTSFFLFSFNLLGRLCPVLIFFFFFLSFFLFFCFLLCFFFIIFVQLQFFFWTRILFFNKGICVNLYKLTFFIPPLFYFQSNKNEEN